MGIELRSEILAELGRNDEVAVAERLKSEAVNLADLLSNLPGDDRQLTEERVLELLQSTSAAGESFLAVALPIIEYGRGDAPAALPRALRHVTVATAAGRQEHTARAVAAVPAVGRLVWALTAFALHCERLQTLSVLARAQIAVPFSDDVRPVLALITLRYPDALGGSAANSFRNYHDWLSGLELLQSYPLFVSEFDAVFLEADLLLAIYTGRLRRQIYSRGHDVETVRRFLTRVNDADQRSALGELFPGAGTVEERLEQAYSSVEGDRQGFSRGPAQLFVAE